MSTNRSAAPVALLLAVMATAVVACTSRPPATADERASILERYSRPLPPGDTALRLVVDPAQMPDLAAAWRQRDGLLIDAVVESQRWFEKPSSRRSYPFEGISHAQAKASLDAFRRLLESSPDEATFLEEVRRRFDVYRSVGGDGQGTVLFTGYYSPIFPASRVRTARFDTPLYRRPDNLVTDEVTGEPRGRRTGAGSIVPYHTRREIDAGRLLAGHELVWLEDELSAYIIHVNGSAKLRLTDSEVMYIGYAGKTDRPYSSLGQAMIRAGLLTPGGTSLQSIKRVFRERPDEVCELMYGNQNYVFFTEYPSAGWPAGSLGVKVTPERTLATDKKVFPRGGLVLVETTLNTFTGGSKRIARFMLDQDTGGAIQAPGRADIFMGIGPGAEILAGGQFAEGGLFYLFLKEEHVDRAGSMALK